MTYHPPPPSEPSGCLQTLIISRMIFQILAIPVALILGMLIGVIVGFIAWDEHPLLGLGVVGCFALPIYLVARWERRRVEREHPPEL